MRLKIDFFVDPPVPPPLPEEVLIWSCGATRTSPLLPTRGSKKSSFSMFFLTVSEEGGTCHCSRTDLAFSRKVGGRPSLLQVVRIGASGGCPGVRGRATLGGRAGGCRPDGGYPLHVEGRPTWCPGWNDGMGGVSGYDRAHVHPPSTERYRTS